MAGLALLLALGCERSAPAPQVVRSEVPSEQRIVNDSLTALEQMRAQPGHEALDTCLRCARAVMVFPHVVWQSGDWRGEGVLLSRDLQGRWSAPAFYGLGRNDEAPVGGQVSSIVLTFMTGGALNTALDGRLTVSAGNHRTRVSGDELCQLVGASGMVYSGGNLQGLAARSLDAHDARYYGADTTARSIVLERRFDQPSSTALKETLSDMSLPPESAPPCNAPSTSKFWRRG